MLQDLSLPLLALMASLLFVEWFSRRLADAQVHVQPLLARELYDDQDLRTHHASLALERQDDGRDIRLALFAAALLRAPTDVLDAQPGDRNPHQTTPPTTPEPHRALLAQRLRDRAHDLSLRDDSRARRALQDDLRLARRLLDAPPRNHA